LDPPSELAEAAWERGHIEPWDLLRITAWKAAITPAWLSVEDPRRIVSVTAAVIKVLKPYRRAVAAEVLFDSPDGGAAFLEATREGIGRTQKGAQDGGLRSLWGIRLPAATAVLTILNPSAWPVIDRWAVTTIFSDPPRILDSVDHYLTYLRRLAALQQHQYPDLTIHEVDLQAMGLGRKGEEPPFERVKVATF
jgi:hypothetical protein